MSTETFNFSHSCRVFSGFGNLTVIEQSFVLPEASLYGAGTTRHKSTVLFTYTDENCGTFVLSSQANQEKQKIFKDESEMPFELQAEKLIREMVENKFVDLLLQEQNDN